jgi:hypothetical protein
MELEAEPCRGGGAMMGMEAVTCSPYCVTNRVIGVLLPTKFNKSCPIFKIYKNNILFLLKGWQASSHHLRGQ